VPHGILCLSCSVIDFSSHLNCAHKVSEPDESVLFQESMTNVCSIVCSHWKQLCQIGVHYLRCIPFLRSTRTISRLTTQPMMMTTSADGKAGWSPVSGS